MAPADVARLTEAHRLAQVRLGGLTAGQVASLWALIDPQNLDGTMARYLAAVVPAVAQRNAESQAMAAAYYLTLRALEVDDDEWTPLDQEPLDEPALVASVTVTGLARAKSAMARGETLDRAMQLGRYGAAGTAMRYALNGGRSMILRSWQADEACTGYVRVTSGNPCAFCADIAGASASPANFAAHDHCSCAAEPQFRSSGGRGGAAGAGRGGGGSAAGDLGDVDLEDLLDDE